MSYCIYNSGVLISTFLLCQTVLSNQASPPAPVHSPEAHTDLICHTPKAAECYPAIFQPTEYFQPIHDDQSIPPGLHVRLNLATGFKEARLNVPESEDTPKADVVLLDDSPKSANEEQLMLEVPDQEEVLTLKELGDNFEDFLSDSGSEMDGFKYHHQNIVRSIGSSSTNLDGKIVLESMGALTELAHAQEWGLAMMSDSNLVHILVKSIDPTSGSSVEIQSAAAQLLGTAIQNNPDALEALLASYAKLDRPSPRDIIHAALDETVTKDLTSENILFQKRLLFFLSQLCHSPQQLEIFIETSGLSTLLAVFDMDRVRLGDGQDKVRTKIANFFTDHVLPIMINWEGGSLLRKLSPGVSISMTGRTSHWMNEMSNVKLWCSAFGRQIMLYEKAGGVRKDSSGAEESILIAFDMLDSALRSHGSEGGCKSVVEDKFTHSENEEL